MRETGTTTSSLIFFGAILRKAGDRALRLRHSRATSSWFTAVSTEIQPGLPAAVAMVSAALSIASALPSTSIINSAPASSGSPGSANSFTILMAEPSMNSSAQGVVG